MHSRIFYTDDDVDYDQILNLDGIDPQPIRTFSNVVNNRQNVSEIEKRYHMAAALQTPKIDSFLNLEKPQTSNFAFSSDSAVGTESQMTKICSMSNLISPTASIQTNQTFEGRGKSPMAQDVNNLVFRLTQDETFSRHFEDSAMDISSDGCRFQSINVRTSSSNGDYASEPRFTNEPTMSNLSFYSLMQRNIMKENIEQPSSSRFQLAMATQDNLTQGVVFTPFFDNRSISGDGKRSVYHQSQEIFSPEVPNFSSVSASYRQFEGSHRDDQSQGQDCFNIMSHQNRPKNAYSIPKSVFDLYTQIKSTDLSDWSFVYALSAQACQEFMPMSYNVALKTSLLLSIASIDLVSVKLNFTLFFKLIRNGTASSYQMFSCFFTIILWHILYRTEATNFPIFRRMILLRFQ